MTAPEVIRQIEAAWRDVPHAAARNPSPKPRDFGL